MLSLYYTVSSAYNAAQTKSVNSLGRYKSSTVVPNDTFDNVFGELSLSTLARAKNEYIALVLKNEGETPIQNVEMWFTTGLKPYCNFLIGATAMSRDEEGNFIMESTPNIYSKPFQTQVYPATEEEKAAIGTMEPGQEIGLWICRQINSEIVEADYNCVAERDIKTENRYKRVEKEKEESVELNISWD